MAVVDPALAGGTAAYRFGSKYLPPIGHLIDNWMPQSAYGFWRNRLEIELKVTGTSQDWRTSYEKKRVPLWLINKYFSGLYGFINKRLYPAFRESGVEDAEKSLKEEGRKYRG